jgi:hypothetical protein
MKCRKAANKEHKGGGKVISVVIKKLLSMDPYVYQPEQKNLGKFDQHW